MVLSGKITPKLFESNWVLTSDKTYLGSREIAEWMDTDVLDKDDIHRRINIFREVKKIQPQGKHLGSGNAHHVFAVGDCIFIFCEYVAENKVLLTCDQAIKALEHYNNFLNSDVDNPDFKVEPFEVEYEAEGEEAERKYFELGGKF